MNKLLENEQLFEQVNVKMAAVTSALTPEQFPGDYVLDLYCECANKACHERLGITYSDYKTAKADAAAFVVKPEHYLPEFEHLTKKTAGYWIIMKRLEKLGKQFEV